MLPPSYVRRPPGWAKRNPIFSRSYRPARHRHTTITATLMLGASEPSIQFLVGGRRMISRPLRMEAAWLSLRWWFQVPWIEGGSVAEPGGRNGLRDDLTVQVLIRSYCLRGTSVACGNNGFRGQRQDAGYQLTALSLSLGQKGAEGAKRRWARHPAKWAHCPRPTHQPICEIHSDLLNY